jgi:hypothetical protein
MKSANCGEVNYATLASAYRNLFSDFMCQSITITQQIKSLVRTHVYYFVYRYNPFIDYLLIKTVTHFSLLF